MNSHLKLDDLSRWATSTYKGKSSDYNGISTSKNNLPVALSRPNELQPYEGSGRNKFTAVSDKFRLTNAHGPRDYEMELTGIRATDELQIDFSHVLNIKRGDLAILQGEVFRCTPKAPNFRGTPLILKRLECIDRKVYDLKVYETDQFMRFRGHANIISLYSYWSEPSSSQYIYKTLVQLFEEGDYGDMLRTVVLNPVRPSNRLILKYVCDIGKALVSIHNSNIIHGAVKPTNIYISDKNNAMLGEFKKVELDSARQTHQLFSKVMIGQAIPKTLIYWAPELLNMEKYGPPSDMWSLGVTLYQVITGEHPFSVVNEERFRHDVGTANVDWSPFERHQNMKILVENLLRVASEKRWSSLDVLIFCQNDFAKDIQRAWRGYMQRREFKRMCRALIKIQAMIKGWLTRIRYLRDKMICRENAVTMIQKKYRSFLTSKSFRKARRALMKCQANVLTRQMARAFQKMRLDVMMAQAFIRRYLAVKWFKQIKVQKVDLENHMENINDMIMKYNTNAQDFKQKFTGKTISGPLKYLESFESYELTKGKTFGSQKTHIPASSNLHSEYQKLQEEKNLLMNRVSLDKSIKSQRGPFAIEQDEDDLKKSLGEKYNDYKPMVEEVKKNLKRVADMVQKAYPLDLRIQHPYSYSKWDQIHEPYNVIENVLKNDNSVYRALTPSLDFTLNHGGTSFIAEVLLYPGDCGPADIEIYISNMADKWAFVKEQRCGREFETKITLPGEQVGKYLRIKCLNNARGGNIVSIRHVMVRGLPKDY